MRWGSSLERHGKVQGMWRKAAGMSAKATETASSAAPSCPELKAGKSLCRSRGWQVCVMVVKCLLF